MINCDFILQLFYICYFYTLVCRKIALVANVICLWKPTLNKVSCILRKVHLVNGHVVYVYWIDTVYVQNNLPIEFSKMTIFII